MLPASQSRSEQLFVLARLSRSGAEFAELGQDAVELAVEFATFIHYTFPDYDLPVQLVGHSLGGHVILAAASALRTLSSTPPWFPS